MIKQTDPSHPDYSDLITAKDDLKEFTMNVNESVRGQEHYRKFSEQVQDPKKYIGFDAILRPHRNLIFESEVEVNMGDRVYTWTLLFTDLLVFASTSGKKKTVEEKLSIEQIWFEDLADLGCETKFRIVTPSSMYLVDVKSVLEKQKWLSIADKTISSWLTNRITFDGPFPSFPPSLSIFYISILHLYFISLFDISYEYCEYSSHVIAMNRANEEVWLHIP